ncbi:hypothetical protein TNCV_306601 [Trichonephila clavipes]|nr:hypothetical protein TNCV_306601 [Trichonephila clavipes]
MKYGVRSPEKLYSTCRDGCAMLSIMRYINSVGSASHCSSQAVESVVCVRGTGLKAAPRRPTAYQTCSTGLRLDDRAVHCIH